MYIYVVCCIMGFVVATTTAIDRGLGSYKGPIMSVIFCWFNWAFYWDFVIDFLVLLVSRWLACWALVPNGPF